MSYNCKNYTEQNGEKTVIGGTLEIKEGATVIGLPKGVNVPDCEATTVAGAVTSINALLQSLRDAGLIEKPSEN